MPTTPESPLPSSEPGLPGRPRKPRGVLQPAIRVVLALLGALDHGERPQVPWTRDTVHGLVYVADAALAVVRALEG